MGGQLIVLALTDQSLDLKIHSLRDAHLQAMKLTGVHSRCLK